MRLLGLFILVLVPTTSCLIAQDAAPPSVDLTMTPAPRPAATPDVPELSTLDEVYKQSSLGKAADDARVRLDVRRLQNHYSHDAAVIDAKNAADAAATDSEKRQRLRDYYRTLYGKMRAGAGSEDVRRAIDAALIDHLRPIAQPNVRPLPDDPSPTPTPKRTPNPKKGKHHKLAPGG
jgi:hypothetical protein